jgi:transcriptional regulator with PAS, ATPase and Fis domain
MGELLNSIRRTGDELAGVIVRRTDRDFLIRSDRHAQPEPEVRFEKFLGMTAVVASAAMRGLFGVAARIGRFSSPVLITGETGTGKELLARAVHHYSTRAAKPFMDVSCAALPEQLADTELFGYEKGAFSGADTGKPGLLESARGGTFFFDEIGELDTRVQARLLRVLDSQSYLRLGGSVKVPVDVRVVAATNLDPDQALIDGKIRRDLFHRLNVFHLHIPPLRDRKEDIAALAAWFLRDYVFVLSPEALRLLDRYSWPGNVRELRNVLLKAALVAAGPRIEPRDLPPEILRGIADPPSDDQYSLDSLERETIRRVLARTGGHQQKAADLLGISRRTLIRKVKLYRSRTHLISAQQRIVA